MNDRERMRAIMHYENYDHMPLVCFGYWNETLDKWAQEGHLTREEAEGWADGNDRDYAIMRKLGFDFNWNCGIIPDSFISPSFTPEVLETKPDGSEIRRQSNGLIVKVKPGVVSIPAHVGTSLTGREAWEEMYLPRLRFRPDRVKEDVFRARYRELEKLEVPIYLHLGSLYGNIRSMLGIEELSYLIADDEELYEEIIDTVGQLCYDCTEAALNLGIPFDYGHFWEDICFKTGPLIRPAQFSRLVGPWYKRITGLCAGHGIDIVSVDCDGKIDELVPVWLENGVNTMFPIEVGTWHACVAPWRETYGRALRGVGGMDKRVFAQSREAVDQEIERLKPLIDLGGYIPCPDHRIAPDAEWDLVRYYCDRFRQVFH
ncbi:MAG: hypothetical protein IKX84_05005 [Clostridia bacterium]|nr:hypothetical protein [Clostridia bacterium]